MANFDNFDKFLKADEPEPEDQPKPETALIPKRKRGRNRTLSNGRDKLTMAEQKTAMSSFWKDGDSYAEIAEKVSDEFGLRGDDRIKPHNVSYHIKSLLKRNRDLSNANINERLAMALARYEQLEWLVTEAYFASFTRGTTNEERMIKMASSKEREKQLREAMKKEKAKRDAQNEKLRAQNKKLIEDPLDDPLGDLPDVIRKTSENIKKYKRTETMPAGDPRWIGMLIDIHDKRTKLWGLLNRQDQINPDQEFAKMPDDERQSRLSALIHDIKVRVTGDRGDLAEPAPLGGFREEDIPDELKIKFVEVEEDEDLTPPGEYTFDEDDD